MSTNRRSIFKALVGAVAMSATDVFGLKVAAPKVLGIPNPAYAAASYEEVVCFHPCVMDAIRGEWKPVGPRFNFVGGKWETVPEKL